MKRGAFFGKKQEQEDSDDGEGGVEQRGGVREIRKEGAAMNHFQKMRQIRGRKHLRFREKIAELRNDFAVRQIKSDEPQQKRRAHSRRK